jgi:hypothetical protein
LLGWALTFSAIVALAVAIEFAGSHFVAPPASG